MAQTSDDSVFMAGSRLLSALPPEVAAEFVNELEEVELTPKQPIYGADEEIAHVYFPLDAVFSIVADMADGTTVEVATVGSEGMVGVPVLLRAGTADYRVFVQIPGRALRLPAWRLLELVAADEDFARLLYRYVQALMTQVARSAACNQVHSIDERAARWLLMTHDRVGSDEFPLTQEFLAQMLGVRRATVNTAAGMLQRAGYITYSRGRIRIADRRGLEASACECYSVIREEYERLVHDHPV